MFAWKRTTCTKFPMQLQNECVIPVSPLLPVHESCKDILGLPIICLHLQKLELFRCGYCDKMGQKEGQDVAPAAVHTGQHCRTPVKFNSRADRSQGMKGAVKNSYWQHSPLNTHTNNNKGYESTSLY